MGIQLGTDFKIIDGFRFVKNTSNLRYDSILIDENLTKEQADYINSKNIVDITTRRMISFEELKLCPKVKRIHIRGDWPNYDMMENGEGYCMNPEGLYRMPNLERLDISLEEKRNIKIDVSRIPKLKKLICNPEKVINIGDAMNLEVLDLWKYREKNLTEFKKLKKLKYLSLVRSSILSLKGIECLKNLRMLDLEYNRRLEDIQDIRYIAKTLTSLSIENSSRIIDFSALSALDNVTFLMIYGNNKIQNLNFIYGMKKLKRFWFDINILDGNLTPCLSLMDVYIGTSRKHYNLKSEELPQNKEPLEKGKTIGYLDEEGTEERYNVKLVIKIDKVDILSIVEYLASYADGVITDLKENQGVIAITLKTNNPQNVIKCCKKHGTVQLSCSIE